MFGAPLPNWLRSLNPTLALSLPPHARRKRRRNHPGVENLESRRLMTVTPQFAKDFSYHPDPEAVATDSSGNTIVAGNGLYGDTFQDYDVRGVSKYNDSGSLIWEKGLSGLDDF